MEIVQDSFRSGWELFPGVGELGTTSSDMGELGRTSSDMGELVRTSSGVRELVRVSL